MKSPFKGSERISLANIQSEVSNLLERLWRYGVSTGPFDGQDFAPAIELREELDRYVVTAELPGLTATALEITAGPASVTIAGEKARPAAPTTEGVQPEYPRVLQNERRYGRFARTVALPGSIQTDAVSAELSEGVLSIGMPKIAAPKPVEIRVDISRPAAGQPPLQP